MTKPTMTVRTPEDFLALVPCVLGFHPHDSIVLLAFGGDAGPFQARVDLPTSVEDVSEIVEVLVTPAQRHRVDQAALVAYGAAGPLLEKALADLEHGLERVGVAVLEVLRVHGGRWFGVRPQLHAQCPDGVAFDLASHPFLAQRIFDGQVIHERREDVADSLRPVSPDLVAEVEVAAFRAATRWHDVQLSAEARWAVERVGRHVEDATLPGIADLGRLLVGVQDASVRDALCLRMTREGAQAHVAFWSKVVRATPEAFVAAPAGVLALAAWLSGDGALAWCAVDRCAEVDPDDSFARLVSELLLAAVPPSTWDPGAEAVLGAVSDHEPG